MKIPILDLKPQYESIKVEIHEAISRVVESGRFIMGPEVQSFEQEVASYLNVKHAIGVNSGTDALVIGLRAAGVQPGDEVITTPFSFFATAESISNVGATPIFADIDPITFNIDPKRLEASITSKTTAIMPVHLYGQPAAMAQIMEISRKHSLKVIEDCAQAFGAQYFGQCVGSDESCDDQIRQSIQGKHTGTIGDVGAFSFFPSKNLGAYGDGGLIATDNDEIADLARMLRTHGAKKKYHNEVLGYNSRLDAIQAAILRVKLPHIGQWNEGRRRVAKTYNELLLDVAGIVTPDYVDGHVFHQYTIRVLNGKREVLKAQLAEQEIGAMTYYPVPQDKLPVYEGTGGSCETSDRYAQEVLSLPIWPELERTRITEIVEVIKSALA